MPRALAASASRPATPPGSVAAARGWARRARRRPAPGRAAAGSRATPAGRLAPRRPRARQPRPHSRAATRRGCHRRRRRACRKRCGGGVSRSVAPGRAGSHRGAGSRDRSSARGARLCPRRRPWSWWPRPTRRYAPARGRRGRRARDSWRRPARCGPRRQSPHHTEFAATCPVLLSRFFIPRSDVRSLPVYALATTQILSRKRAPHATGGRRGGLVRADDSGERGPPHLAPVEAGACGVE